MTAMKKILNFTVGLIIIFLILYLSKWVLSIFNIAFPSALLGIIILFIMLKTGVIKENWIKDFCDFMLKYMILFFIPIFVGVVDYFEIISKNLVAILATIFITTTLVIVVTGLFTYNVIKFQRLKRMKKWD